jgi:hypothetical protein
VFCVPVPRQEVADPFRRVIKNSCEDVSQPGLRVDAVELGCRDQRVGGSRPPATFVGSGEGPVAAPDRNGTQLTLRSIVRHAETSIVEEAGERCPALEAVVDGLTGLAVLGNPGALLAVNAVSNFLTCAEVKFPRPPISVISRQGDHELRFWEADRDGAEAVLGLAH